MNKLFKQALLSAMISTAVASCGVDEGLDYNFSSSKPVTFDEAPFSKTYSEMSGVVEIDLLEGAMVDGKALSVDSHSSPVFIREFQFSTVNTAFTTPQGEGNQGNNNVSPFTMSDDGTKLVLDTDAFEQALRMCDESDVRGGTNSDGTPAPDGVRDFPTSVTYNIAYIVDVGHELAPGEEVERRTLSLTINAISDPVTEVQAFDLAIASGANTPMLSATAPTYACNSALTYSIADTSIATVDADGNVTGANQGETVITVTSVEDPSLSAQALISVTPGFNLEIVNQDYNELGAPLETKSVPACSDVGIEVFPSIVNDDLTGAYSYTWQSESADVVYQMSGSDGTYGATGRFSNAMAAGDTAKISVELDSGYTGATAISDVAGKTVTVTAERNLACDPDPNVDGAQWYASDLALDAGGWGPNATHVAGGLDGTALQITYSGGDAGMYANVVQQQWNQSYNYHAATYGRGETSIGRKFKFSVWAKLNQIPTGDVTLEQSIIPWNCDGCDGLANFPARYDAGVSGNVNAVLKPTTEWQFVELINPITGTNVWEVPANWNVATAAFATWNLFGMTDGETIQLDNYGIVEVD